MVPLLNPDVRSSAHGYVNCAKFLEPSNQPRAQELIGRQAEASSSRATAFETLSDLVAEGFETSILGNFRISLRTAASVASSIHSTFESVS